MRDSICPDCGLEHRTPCRKKYVRCPECAYLNRLSHNRRHRVKDNTALDVVQYRKHQAPRESECYLKLVASPNKEMEIDFKGKCLPMLHWKRMMIDHIIPVRTILELNTKEEEVFFEIQEKPGMGRGPRRNGKLMLVEIQKIKK